MIDIKCCSHGQERVSESDVAEGLPFSNCICQVAVACHFWRLFHGALAMLTSFLATAVMMNLCGFPTFRRRSAKDFRFGVWYAASTAAWNITCLRARRRPAVVRFPRRVPLSCATVAKPVSAAAWSPVMAPISGISAISIVLATGPIPGMERRTPAVSERRSSLAMVRVIRSSSSLIRLSIRCFNSVSGSRAESCLRTRRLTRTGCARVWPRREPKR